MQLALHCTVHTSHDLSPSPPSPPTTLQDALHAKLVALIKLNKFGDALALIENDRAGVLG